MSKKLFEDSMHHISSLRNRLDRILLEEEQPKAPKAATPKKPKAPTKGTKKPIGASTAASDQSTPQTTQNAAPMASTGDKNNAATSSASNSSSQSATPSPKTSSTKKKAPKAASQGKYTIVADDDTGTIVQVFDKSGLEKFGILGTGYYEENEIGLGTSIYEIDELFANRVYLFTPSNSNKLYAIMLGDNKRDVETIRGPYEDIGDLAKKYQIISSIITTDDIDSDYDDLVSITNNPWYDFRIKEFLENAREGNSADDGIVNFLEQSNASKDIMKKVYWKLDTYNDYYAQNNVMFYLAKLIGDPDLLIEHISTDLPNIFYLPDNMLSDPNTAMQVVDAAIEGADYIDKHMFRYGMFEDYGNNVRDMMMEFTTNEDLHPEARRKLMSAIRSGVFDIK